MVRTRPVSTNSAERMELVSLSAKNNRSPSVVMPLGWASVAVNNGPFGKGFLGAAGIGTDNAVLKVQGP